MAYQANQHHYANPYPERVLIFDFAYIDQLLCPACAAPSDAPLFKKPVIMALKQKCLYLSKGVKQHTNDNKHACASEEL